MQWCSVGRVCGGGLGLVVGAASRSGCNKRMQHSAVRMKHSRPSPSAAPASLAQLRPIVLTALSHLLFALATPAGGAHRPALPPLLPAGGAAKAGGAAGGGGDAARGPEQAAVNASQRIAAPRILLTAAGWNVH